MVAFSILAIICSCDNSVGSDATVSFLKKSSILLKKDKVTKEDIRKIVFISSKCRMKFGLLVIKEKKVITGLPLFDSAINGKRIKEVLHDVIKSCN